MSPERRETKKVNMATDRQADRLSSIPDDPLYHVLSFLPAHEVVLTVKGCTNPEWFVNFIHNMLLLRDHRAQLDSFKIDLDDRDFDFKEFLPANEEHVNRWFQHAVMCGPRALLALRTTDGIYILELQMVDVYNSTLNFSGCPALVHLKIDDSDIEGNITSPLLQHLSINRSYFQIGPFHTRIHTPNLVSLELINVMCRAPVLAKNMPLMIRDCDDLQCYGCHSFERGVDDRRRKSVLFKGLSEVTQLEYYIILFLCTVYCQDGFFKLSPIFSKLKTLLLSKWCPGIASDLNILSCFLKHSPILEKLTLHLSEVLYFAHEQYLLKMVEIKCKEVDERAHKVLNILSTHGIPLEKVKIHRA
ncbi:hypothetical protein VPH35_030955 [Triticum aestivum]